MHEINVLPIELSWLIYYIKYIQGGYPELNRELTVPHTVVLPIELYPPLDSIEFYILHYPRKKKFFLPTSDLLR